MILRLLLAVPLTGKEGNEVVSCCVCYKPDNIMQHMHDKIPYKFAYRANPVVRSFLSTKEFYVNEQQSLKIQKLFNLPVTAQELFNLLRQ